MTVRYAFTICD